MSKNTLTIGDRDIMVSHILSTDRPEGRETDILLRDYALHLRVYNTNLAWSK